MIYHFSTYHCGSLEAVTSEWDGTEAARAEAFRLLQRSTELSCHDGAPSAQTRVVVRDGRGTDLFTLAYIAAEAAARHAASGQ